MFINRYCICTVLIHERLNTDANTPGPRSQPGALCCVLEEDTLKEPLSTQVYKGYHQIYFWDVTLWWTSIPSRGGSRNTPSGLMLLNPGQVLARWAAWLVCRLYLSTFVTIIIGEKQVKIDDKSNIFKLNKIRNKLLGKD